MIAFRGLTIIAAALSVFIASTTAHAQSATQEQALEETDDKILGGLGTMLNFRGVADEFDVDGTVSAGPNRNTVEAVRATARVLVLPELRQSVGWWGISGGVRAGAYGFGGATDPTGSIPGGVAMANVEPSLGVVFATAGDRLRLEIDVAPVLSTGEGTRLSQQEALVAALSTAPHDDLLFLPNLVSAERLRIALSRRWDFFDSHFGLAVGTEAEVGHAQTQTTFGSAQGETGGGEVDLRLYFRHLAPFIEGIILQGSADVGYTSVWSSDVVLPMRIAGTLTFAVSRTFEIRTAVACSTTSIPLSSFNSWATSLGIRWSFDRSAPTWTRRHLDMEPEIQGLETR